MVAGVFDELALEQPRHRFTVGIVDDVSGTSLDYDPSLDIEPADTVRAVFFGLGADGTVGANKNTIKILGAEEDLNAQGYFVYDSKKSGSQTVSHLRFGPRPIRAPYLVQQRELRRLPPVRDARPGRRARPGGARRDAAAELPARAGRRSGTRCRGPSRSRSSPRASTSTRSTPAEIAREVGLAGRINIVLQTCFFAISGVLPARGGDRPDQGSDHQDVRTARRRGGRTQPCSRRPSAGGLAPDRPCRTG